MRYESIRNIVGIVLVGFVNYLLLTKVEEGLVFEMVVPVAGVTINQWIDNFRSLALIGIFGALIAAFTWYVLAQWIFKVNSWKDTGKRPIWMLILILPVIIVIIMIFSTPQAQEGEWIAYVFQLVNGFFCYYFGTLLFSPSSFKYTPPLAKFFRRVW